MQLLAQPLAQPLVQLLVRPQVWLLEVVGLQLPDLSLLVPPPQTIHAVAEAVPVGAV
jgi:hypothetical protein